MSFSNGFCKVAASGSEKKDSTGLSTGSKALAMAGAGLGTYAMLRRKKLHGGKALQAIQKKSDRVVKLMDPADIPSGKGTNSWLRRALDPTEYVSKGKDFDPRKAAVIDLETGGSLKGAVNYSPARTREKILKAVSYDKKSEQKFISKNLGKGLSIPTKTMSELIVGKGKTKEDALEHLHKKYPRGFFIKQRGGYGAMETGNYAHSGTKLDEGSRQSEFLRKALNKRNAHKYVIQPKQDIQNEFRVHVLGNQVLPGFTFHRAMGALDTLPHRALVKSLPKSITGDLSNVPLTEATHKLVEKKLQRALSKKNLPKGQLFGMDVAIGKNGKIKIVETNPSDIAGYSGFLDQKSAPLHRSAGLYKALTGRRAPYQAALGGAAAAAGTGVGVHQVDQFIQESKKKDTKGPYKAG